MKCPYTLGSNRTYLLSHSYEPHSLYIYITYNLLPTYSMFTDQLPVRKEEARLLMEQQLAEKQAAEAAELVKQEKLQDEVKDVQ